MLLALLLALGAVWIAGIALAVVHIRRAPIAVENEDGFQIVGQSGEMEVATSSVPFEPVLRTN